MDEKTILPLRAVSSWVVAQCVFVSCSDTWGVGQCCGVYITSLHRELDSEGSGAENCATDLRIPGCVIDLGEEREGDSGGNGRERERDRSRKEYISALTKDSAASPECQGTEPELEKEE
ncbi:uncharacterized protein LOC133745492 [Rosa rugosa]|uniref:uncharacterized protein LOC133745492 n=1 Tax=Rosa rugosa TaxID=74645 RepID=UPI002B40543D|nr:uncharacterized protein LOC133745492 [Rosa rugosa]